MTPLEQFPYDAADFIRDEQDAEAYLEAAREDGDPRVIAAAEAAVQRWRDRVITVMTLAEMKAACEQGQDDTDWERLRYEAEHGIEPQSDPDSPDCTDAIRARVRRTQAP